MKKLLLSIFSIIACSAVGLAQSPDISYSVTAVKLEVGKAMPTLTPTNKGGAIPADAGYGQVTTFAGSRRSGNQNGTGKDILFNVPAGIALDKAGNIYVSDYNNIIRKITPAGVATTFAGSTYGFADGTGTAAKFYDPNGIAFDAAGNLYVADAQNNRIRKITPAGVVSTFAGTGTGGSDDGVANKASFYNPLGVVADLSGNVFVGDEFNNKVRKITPGGVVSTYAGTGYPGTSDGPAEISSFNFMAKLDIDKHGNVFVADDNNRLIREITPDGKVSTFAGWNAEGAVAPNDIFSMPISVKVDANDNVYVADAKLNKIFKITPDGTVSILAGSGKQDLNDGIGTAASFYVPTDIALDGLNAMYVTDGQNNEIRKIGLTGYSITPDLPAGLSFNATTGVISGTLTAAVPQATYTVTGYNSKGSSSFKITLSTSGVAFPAITSFTPAHAKTGDAVTITGTNFTGATAVAFGGTPAASFIVNSATSITAKVAGGASGNVTVTTPGGTANVAGFVYDVVPTLTSFTPTHAGQNATVTITGTNLIGATAVTFGGKFATSVTVNSATSMTAKVGAGSSGDIMVFLPSGTVSIPGFVYDAVPAITSFTPINAAQDATVTITGTNLTGATAVTFGGTPAASFTVNSATSITATVGTGTTGDVVITTPSGTASKSGFQYSSSTGGVNITSFSPATAGTGALVSISGSGFTGATAVTFGGTPAASFTVNSAGSITAKVGTGTSGNIVITTPSGTASKSGFQYSVSTGGVSITSFSPQIAGTGASVVISGSGFTGATAVTFGSKPAKSFSVNSPESITAVPDGGASGNVTVTTPSGNASLGGFTFTDAPVITSFSPQSSGSSELVTITGANFTGATSVKFGGVEATYFNVDSPTGISAVVGAGASGDVTVTTPGGIGKASGYTFVIAPGITSFTPQHAAAGETVTITGSHFTGVDDVEFGNVKAQSYTIVSDSQIKAVVGNGATGKIYLAHASESTTAGLFTYDNTGRLPDITNFTPKIGGANTQVTIGGSFFTGTTKVTIGGVDAKSFTIISDNQILATIAAGTGNTGVITVTTSGGTASASGLTFIPKPIITPAGTVSLTPGESVVLQSTTGPDYNYRWFRDSVAIDGATTPNYTATQTGSYYMRVIVGDFTVTSDQVVVSFPELSLPADNFSVQVTNLACKGDNNGIIKITAQKTLNYTATISGDTIIQHPYPFTNDLTLSNLRAGGYTICMSVEGYPQYQQCYMVTITEPKDLAVYTAVDKKKNQVNLQLNGGTSYTIRLNDAVYTTRDSSFTLKLAKGSNRLSVSTDKLCQGVIEKIINDTGNLIPYPNPFEKTLYVNLGEATVDIATVKIYNVADGRLMLQHTYTNQSGVVQLDVSGLVSGVYSYHLSLNNTENVFKIYKK